MNSSFFFHVYDRAYLVPFVGKHADRLVQQVLNKKYLIIPMDSKIKECAVAAEQTFVPNSLIEIYKFDEMVRHFERRNSQHILVFSTGSSKEVQGRVAFLIGCTLIMSKSLDVCEVRRIFQKIGGFLRQSSRHQESIMDCWQALYQAKSLVWLDFREQLVPDSDEESTINIEELIHYSR